MNTSGIYMKKTKISKITSRNIDFELRVRVINLWSTPDRVNPTDEGAIHMIFLDESLGRIQATIRKHLIPIFKGEIMEGNAYHFERFMVAKNNRAFKTTPHKYKLNFMRSTKVFKVIASEIPMYHYDFMSFQRILTSTEEDRLLDVIGHIVEKNDTKGTGKNRKTNHILDVILEDLEGNRVHCTLWDQYAKQMQQFLDASNSSSPIIIILQMCKLRKFLGTMGISNYIYGTKLILNAELPEVANYVERMNSTNVELTQGVSQISNPNAVTLADDLLQTQRMTIEDLIESKERCIGSVLVLTSEFDTDMGWFYKACTKCACRIILVEGQLYCKKCKIQRTTVPRYKVHLQVTDDTGSITFVMFDRVVSQFLGRTAQELLDNMTYEGRSNSYPTQLNAFVNKRMLFKVEVTDANLHRNWRIYAVMKLTGEEDIIDQFASLHGINLAAGDEHANYNDLNCGLTNNTLLEIAEGSASTNNEESFTNGLMYTPPSGSINRDYFGASTPPSQIIEKNSMDVCTSKESTVQTYGITTPTSKPIKKRARARMLNYGI